MPVACDYFLACKKDPGYKADTWGTVLRVSESAQSTLLPVVTAVPFSLQLSCN